MWLICDAKRLQKLFFHFGSFGGKKSRWLKSFQKKFEPERTSTMAPALTATDDNDDDDDADDNDGDDVFSRWWQKNQELWWRHQPHSLPHPTPSKMQKIFKFCENFSFKQFLEPLPHNELFTDFNSCFRSTFWSFEIWNPNYQSYLPRSSAKLSRGNN